MEHIMVNMYKRVLFLFFETLTAFSKGRSLPSHKAPDFQTFTLFFREAGLHIRDARKILQKTSPFHVTAEQ